MKNENDVLAEIDQNAEAAKGPQERLVGGPPAPVYVPDVAEAPFRGYNVPEQETPVSNKGRLISRVDKPITIWVIDAGKRVQMRVSPRSNQEFDSTLIPDPLPPEIAFVPYGRTV